MKKIKRVEVRLFTEVLAVVYGPREKLPVTGYDNGISEWSILDALWMEREKSRYPEHVLAYEIYDDGTETDYLEMYASRADYLKQHGLGELVRSENRFDCDLKRNICAFAWSEK